MVLAAFFAQFVGFGVFSYLLGPFMLPMIDDLGWPRAEFTLSRSVGQVVMGVAGFVIGSYVDRLGARPLMLIGATVLTLVLAAHSQVETLWQWVLLNGIALTVGCAMVGNLVVNVTMAKWFVEKRGQAVAWAAMGVSFAGILLMPGATWFIDILGWRHAWLALAACLAALVFPAALVMRRAPEDYGWHPDGRSQQQVNDGLAQRAADDYARSMTRSQALRTPAFYLLVLAFGLFSINIVVLLLQTVPYLTDAGFTRRQGALCVLLASVLAMATKPLWGYFIDRSRPKPLAAMGGAITGLALLGVVAAVSSQALPWIYAAYLLLGIGWGGMMPLQEVIWGLFFGRRYLGAVRSVGMSLTLLLGAGAPLLVSYYHDLSGSYHGALVVVALLNLLSALILATMKAPSAGVSRVESSLVSVPRTVVD